MGLNSLGRFLRDRGHRVQSHAVMPPHGHPFGKACCGDGRRRLATSLRGVCGAAPLAKHRAPRGPATCRRASRRDGVDCGRRVDPRVPRRDGRHRRRAQPGAGRRLDCCRVAESRRLRSCSHSRRRPTDRRRLGTRRLRLEGGGMNLVRIWTQGACLRPNAGRWFENVGEGEARFKLNKRLQTEVAQPGHRPPDVLALDDVAALEVSQAWLPRPIDAMG
jgi:hypothetical protein